MRRVTSALFDLGQCFLKLLGFYDDVHFSGPSSTKGIRAKLV